MTRFLSALAATTLMLAGCSSLPAMPSLPSLPGFSAPESAAPEVVEAEIKTDIAAPLAVEATAREHINRAVLLLGSGRAEEARAHLTQALQKSPSEKVAANLLQQIDGDPMVLLGQEHQTYTVVAGDTMSALAARHLGDPMKFYLLSRYNGLASPDALRVGAILKIPKSAVVSTAATTPAPAATAAAATATSEPLVVNAAKANTTRLQGLEALNKGQIALAVDLLQQAEKLNKGDPAIQRDLERARRIQSSLADG